MVRTKCSLCFLIVLAACPAPTEPRSVSSDAAAAPDPGPSAPQVAVVARDAGPKILPDDPPVDMAIIATGTSASHINSVYCDDVAAHEERRVTLFGAQVVRRTARIPALGQVIVQAGFECIRESHEVRYVMSVRLPEAAVTALKPGQHPCERLVSTTSTVVRAALGRSWPTHPVSCQYFEIRGLDSPEIPFPDARSAWSVQPGFVLGFDEPSGVVVDGIFVPEAVVGDEHVEFDGALFVVVGEHVEGLGFVEMIYRQTLDPPSSMIVFDDDREMRGFDLFEEDGSLFVKGELLEPRLSGAEDEIEGDFDDDPEAVLPAHRRWVWDAEAHRFVATATVSGPAPSTSSP